jgi:pimeloyl-ACP methyl ester carboxylesterase
MKRILKTFSLIVLTLMVAVIIWLGYWMWGQNQEIAELEINVAEDIAPGQFVSAYGRQIHVVIKGDLKNDPTGAPLLLLHGFSTAGQDTWFPWADSLTENRTIIVPDMLNFGFSAKVVEPDLAITHEGQAAHLRAMLDALGIDQVDLVARSYGGAVGSQMILDYPGRVRRVAYVGAHVYWDEDSNRAAQIGRALGRLPMGIGRALVWNSMGGGDNSFAGHACLQEAKNCQRLEIARIRGTVDGMRALSLITQVSRMPQDIGLIKIPASVFWGAEDPVVPLENGERLAKTLNAKLYVTPGAGHWPYETDPEGFTQDLSAFFTEKMD